MISRGRKRRGYWQRRKGRRNLLPTLLTVGIIGFLLFWIGKTIWQFTSNIRSEQTSALVSVVQGSIEFSLSGNDKWTSGASEEGTRFFTGDKLRTQNNSEASIKLFERSILFLNENTEIEITELSQNSKGRQTADIKLIRGQIWANVDSTSLQADKNSSFVINTPGSSVHIKGTIFDLKVADAQETLRLTRGKVDVDVYADEERKNPTTLSVGVGQKLVVNAETKQQITSGAETLASIDNTFIESDWHLNHLEQFFPEEAGLVRRSIEIATPAPTTEEGDATPTDESIAAPTILTPADGAVIPAGSEDLQVEGTAPPEAEFVTVNGYTLTKYIPGDRKWSYFASKKFGTLIPGENTYTVVATTRDGRKSPVSSIKITYEGTTPAAPSAATEAVPALVVEDPDFANPVITRPATGSFNDAYQTSSRVITITGIVDPKTTAVEVNGFRLQKFRAGKTEFSYIANATYGNLREGENTYTITAFGPNDKTATASVKIIYTPLDIGQ